MVQPDDGLDPDTRAYVDQMGQLNSDESRIASQLRDGLARGDSAASLEAARRASLELADVVSTMRALSPPAELGRFHTLMLEAAITQKRYVDESQQYLASGGGLDGVSRLYSDYVGRRRDAYAAFDSFAAAHPGAKRYRLSEPGP